MRLTNIMRTLKFKTQPTVAVFPSVNHRSRRRKSRKLKRSLSYAVIGGFRSTWRFLSFAVLWLPTHRYLNNDWRQWKTEIVCWVFEVQVNLVIQVQSVLTINPNLHFFENLAFVCLAGPRGWAIRAGVSHVGALPSARQGRGGEQLWQDQHSATDLHIQRIRGLFLAGLWSGICGSGMKRLKDRYILKSQNTANLHQWNPKNSAKSLLCCIETINKIVDWSTSTTFQT